MRALQELEKSMQVASLSEEPLATQRPIVEVTLDLTGAQRRAKVRYASHYDSATLTLSHDKANMLLARWIGVSERWEDSKVDKAMSAAADMWPECVFRSLYKARVSPPLPCNVQQVGKRTFSSRSVLG